MTDSLSKYAYLIAGFRTPIGAFLGGLSTLSAPQLGSTPIDACQKLLGNAQPCEVIMGNVLQAGVGQAPARQAALLGGVSHTVPCVTVNKVCGSGLKAVMLADQAVRSGDASQIIAGGMESMSNAPFLLKTMRTGAKFGDQQAVDAMQYDGLTCAFDHCLMGNHAEYTAEKYGISRESQDIFATQSQNWAEEARRQRLFEDEIVPINLQTRKGTQTVAQDECIRESVELASLQKLRPVFQENGTVTAGNASCIADGAAAVLVTDHHHLEAADPGFRFRILASYTSGTQPKDLFVAPVSAIEGVLEKAGISKEAVDFFEINEAFAAQMIACTELLGLASSNVNVNGGGISLGHPIGASGARCLVTLMHTLHRNQARLGVVSLCLGGGNAVAMLIENMAD